MSVTNLSRLLIPTVFSDERPSFDRPWSPMRLVLLSLASSLAVAGVFFGMNQHRLGWMGGQSLCMACIASSVVGYVVTLIGIGIWLHDGFWLPFLIMAIGPKIGNTFFAICIALAQFPRFRTYRDMGIAEGPAWQTYAAATTTVIGIATAVWFLLISEYSPIRSP